ncbi:MAG: SAM-dependent methyltransferase [Campylobacterales bacterium]|nr:SAM-dependent methyltransferase [Campylobacterales bacterium]HEO97942.1 class I SAM-dependent methyltransferase [Campylobacterota bacterium]
MKLENIVPWGRNLSEYQAMFLLSDLELRSKIVGCGDGPASFNAEVTALGGDVVSVDPLYRFSKMQIAQRIDEVADKVLEQVKQNEKDFVWHTIPGPEALYTLRMEAMQQFLDDYEEGKKEGRYIEGALPDFSFEENQFDLALSSHFLFLYSEHLDEAFHLRAIEEMLRVAKEVRIFPLVTLEGHLSQHLKGVIERLERSGFSTEVISTAYEFQKGGDKMLKIGRGEG